MRKLKKNSDNTRTVKGSADATYIATLVNPVDHRLYDIVSLGGTYVLSPMPSDDYSDESKTLNSYGHGNYDTHDEKELEYDGETQIYYRSHTPSGVVSKGKGIGLLLYSGLSLDVVRFFSGSGGVYSETKLRSADASRWWVSQVQRGFAQKGETHSTGSEEVDLDIDEDTVRHHLSEEDAYITSVYPDRVEVTVEFETQQEIEFLPAAKVAESGIVIAWDTEDQDLDSVLSKTEPAPLSVLVELDLSTTRDPELIASILSMLRDRGASRKQLLDFSHKLPGPLSGSSEQELQEMLGQQRIPLQGEWAEWLNTGEAMQPNPREEVRHKAAWDNYFGSLTESD